LLYLFFVYIINHNEYSVIGKMLYLKLSLIFEWCRLLGKTTFDLQLVLGRLLRSHASQMMVVRIFAFW